MGRLRSLDVFYTILRCIRIGFRVGLGDNLGIEDLYLFAHISLALLSLAKIGTHIIMAILQVAANSYLPCCIT